MNTFAIKINEDKIKKVAYPGGSYYIHLAPYAVKFLRICRKAKAQGFNALENCWGEICTLLPKRITYSWADMEADRLGLYDLLYPEIMDDIELHGVEVELPKREATQTRTRRVRGEYRPKQR